MSGRGQRIAFVQCGPSLFEMLFKIEEQKNFLYGTKKRFHWATILRIFLWNFENPSMKHFYRSRISKICIK